MNEWYDVVQLWLIDRREGVLELDSTPQKAREDPVETAFRYTMLYALAPLLAVVAAIGLFVLLRNWKRSPCYKPYTFQ